MEFVLKKHIAIMLTVVMVFLFIPTVSFAASSADTIKYTTTADEEFNFD